MFSRKMVLIVGVIVLIAVNTIVLSVSNRRFTSFGLERIAISFISPFQELVTRTTVYQGPLVPVFLSGQRHAAKSNIKDPPEPGA